MHYAEFAEDEVCEIYPSYLCFDVGISLVDLARRTDVDQSQSLLLAIKEYEANKWKEIGKKVGKPAKVLSLLYRWEEAILIQTGLRTIREGALWQQVMILMIVLLWCTVWRGFKKHIYKLSPHLHLDSGTAGGSQKHVLDGQVAAVPHCSRSMRVLESFFYNGHGYSL